MVWSGPLDSVANGLGHLPSGLNSPVDPPPGNSASGKFRFGTFRFGTFAFGTFAFGTLLSKDRVEQKPVLRRQVQRDSEAGFPVVTAAGTIWTSFTVSKPGGREALNFAADCGRQLADCGPLKRVSSEVEVGGLERSDFRCDGRPVAKGIGVLD